MAAVATGAIKDDFPDGLPYCETCGAATDAEVQMPEKLPGKIRQCWVCGKDMGFIENRYYDRSDTCGDRECDREARDAHESERQEAHEELDRQYDAW